MSEKKQTKINKTKLAKLQVIGLWVLLIGSGLFWGGVTVGTQATLNAQAHEAQVKTEAIEEYKASLDQE